MPSFHYYDPYHDRIWAHLKEMIASGVPVTVRLYPGKHYPMDEEKLFKVSDREGHVVNIVGYDEQTREVYIFDPWNKSWGGDRGDLTKMPYEDLIIYNVNCTREAPVTNVNWSIVLNTSKSEVEAGEEFIVSAKINYLKPRFVSNSENHIHALHAQLEVPSGLQIIGDKSVKRVGDGYLQPGEFKTVQWLVKSDKPLSKELQVSFKGIVSSMDPYPYSDIIGAKQTSQISVKKPTRSFSNN